MQFNAVQSTGGPTHLLMYLVTVQACICHFSLNLAKLCNVTCICPAHKDSNWLGCFCNHKIAIHKSSIVSLWVTDKLDVAGDSEVWNQATSSSPLPPPRSLTLHDSLQHSPSLSPISLYRTSRAESLLLRMGGGVWWLMVDCACVHVRMPVWCYLCQGWDSRDRKLWQFMGDMFHTLSHFDGYYILRLFVLIS